MRKPVGGPRTQPISKAPGGEHMAEPLGLRRPDQSVTLRILYILIT